MAWMSAIAAVAPSVIGAFGAKSQADAQDRALQAERERQARYESMGAPYRQRLSDLYKDPSDFLSSPEVQIPVQNASNVLSRALSTQGNPIGSGNAMTELYKSASENLFGRLGQEKDRLGGFGGLAQYNAAAPSMNINQMNPYKADIWNAAGVGASALNNMFNPPKESALDAYLRSITK